MAYRIFRSEWYGKKITNKKSQQRDIDLIVSNLAVYRNEIDEIAKKLKAP